MSNLNLKKIVDRVSYYIQEKVLPDLNSAPKHAYIACENNFTTLTLLNIISVLFEDCSCLIIYNISHSFEENSFKQKEI